MSKKIGIIFFGLCASPAWASSSLECINNQGLKYFNQNRVGGARPFPGMVTNLEKIFKNHHLVYQVVTREDCAEQPDCALEHPELQDVIPEGFGFGFDAKTKQVLASDGSPSGPTFQETYVIQFRFDLEPETWMLCDYSQVLAP